MRSIAIAAVILGFAAQSALAQHTPVYQSGLVTPRHATMWSNNGVAMDSGGSAGGPPGVGLSELGITNTGTPFCINDAPITSPGGYHQLCLASTVFGEGALTYNAYGGAQQQCLVFIINGVTYQQGACARVDTLGLNAGAPFTAIGLNSGGALGLNH